MLSLHLVCRPAYRYRTWVNALLIGFAATLTQVISVHAAPVPNILFILTEDQGGHLSYLGTPGLETPNMDRIARQGVYFERAYVNYPVCSPSKANIYTGTYAHTNGMISNTHNFFVPADQLNPGQLNNPIYKRVRIGDRFTTLTEIFEAEGYYSGVSGKLHVSPNEKFPYDEWFKKNEKGRTLQMIRNAQEVSKPFFFFANIQAPHRPFRNSDNVKIGVDPAEVDLPAFLPDTPIARQDWAEYLDFVEIADKQLGDVLAAVEEAGEMENTLVILMGDHGPAYHRGKMSLYQFGLNVPFAIAGPGIPQGIRTKEMISGVDVMATLMDLLGLPIPSSSQGESVASVVLGQHGATGRQNVFAEIIHQGQSTDNGMQERSVFDGRYKLIYRENAHKPRDVNSDLKYWVFETPGGARLPWHNRVYDEVVKQKDSFPLQYKLLTKIDPQTYGVKLPKFELYDTENDPNEFNDLSDDKDQRELLIKLKSTLKKWLNQTNDPYTSS